MAEINLDCGACQHSSNWPAIESGLRAYIDNLNKALGRVVEGSRWLKDATEIPVDDPRERAKRDQDLAHAVDTVFGASADAMSLLGSIDSMIEVAGAIDCPAQADYPASCPRLGHIMLALPQMGSEAEKAAAHWEQQNDLFK